MSELPVSGGYERSNRPYMGRVMPWGETCGEAETRLKKLRLRQKWLKRRDEIRTLTCCSMNDAAYTAMLEFEPTTGIAGEGESEEILSDDDRTFVEMAREGLMLDLPLKASVERELEWVGANLHKSTPGVRTAPSLMAINYIIDARCDPKIRATFWNTLWSKRMSPGDRGKAPPSPFAGDRVEVLTEDGERDAELMRTMKERLGEA